MKTIFYTTIMILVASMLALAGPIRDVHIRDTDDDRLEVNADGTIDVNTVVSVGSITEIASGTFRICNEDYSTCVDVAPGNSPALRVEIGDGYDLANVDATGHLFIADGSQAISVDDDGGSLTVDGTVTCAGVSATDTAVITDRTSGVEATVDSSGALNVTLGVGTASSAVTIRNAIDGTPWNIVDDTVNYGPVGITDGTTTADILDAAGTYDPQIFVLTDEDGNIFADINTGTYKSLLTTITDGSAVVPVRDFAGGSAARGLQVVETNGNTIYTHITNQGAKSVTTYSSGIGTFGMRDQADSGQQIPQATITVADNWTWATSSISTWINTTYDKHVTDISIIVDDDLGAGASDTVPVQMILWQDAGTDEEIYSAQCNALGNCHFPINGVLHIPVNTNPILGVRLSSRAGVGGNVDVIVKLNGYVENQ